MKKILFIALAALTTVAASAQSKEAQAVLKKIERSDAAIADAKKAAKINTWIDRAEIFTEATAHYTSSLVAQTPIAQLQLILGEPKAIEEATLQGEMYSKYIFPTLDLYVNNSGSVIYWEAREELYANAPQEAIASLEKAKEINAKSFATSSKSSAVVNKLAAELNSVGRNLYAIGKPEQAGDAFMGAYEVKELKGQVDTVAFYFSGICYFEAENYAKAQQTFENMLSMGSAQEGLTYYYLAGCYEKQDNINKAIEIYEEGFTKYPENASLMGGLINAYILAERSPEELITLIKRAQDVDPTNVSLYLVEAQIWEQSGNRVESYKALDNALELDPTSMHAMYNYAVFKVMESDALVEEANKLDINDVETYEKMMVQVADLRKEAVVLLEECYALYPQDASVIDLLRQMYFICRDYGNEYKSKLEAFNNTHPQ